MPKGKDVKIKSEPRRKRRIYTVLLVVCLFFVSYGLLSFHSPSDMPILQVDHFNYKLLVANTVSEQQKGLGGRQLLPNNEAMLFVFQRPIKQCFWMKDMNFPIDIIWLRASKRVVYLRGDVLPSSYPGYFCPTSPSLYAIELNAGQAKARDIHIGETLVF